LLLIKILHGILQLRGPDSFDVEENMLKYVPAKEFD
jgi:hypothetical protein